MKTYRVRRSRPSALSLALALALTMLIVYLASVSARESDKNTIVPTQAESAAGTAEVRLSPMKAYFVSECACPDELSARVAAAKCAQNGGAGFVLEDNGKYHVIREASLQPGGETELTREAGGLTLRLAGRAADVTAVSDAVEFLWEQAAQTGSLASAMDAGETDADSVRALLNVYRTQGRRASEALRQIEGGTDVTEMLSAAVNCALERVESALRDATSAKMRRIHAAACAEWIRLLDDLSDMN